jgi:hypothetical protein
MTLAVLFGAGCSAPQPPQPPSQPEPPAKTVFDPLTQQIDRTRAVQKTVDYNAETIRKAADNEERGDPASR